MSRKFVVGMAVLALGAAFAAGRASGAGSAVAPAAGTSVTAAEGYGLVALRNTYDPGESAPLHEHAAPRLVVVLSGGSFEVTAGDGAMRTVDLAAGQVMFRGPETHALKNVGDTTIETIELDLNRGQQP